MLADDESRDSPIRFGNFFIFDPKAPRVDTMNKFLRPIYFLMNRLASGLAANEHLHTSSDVRIRCPRLQALLPILIRQFRL